MKWVSKFEEGRDGIFRKDKSSLLMEPTSTNCNFVPSWSLLFGICLDQCKCNAIASCCPKKGTTTPRQESIFEMAMRAEEIKEDAFSSCYQVGVQMYGIFIDNSEVLWKRFLGDEGNVGEGVVSVDVKELDGFYRK